MAPLEHRALWLPLDINLPLQKHPVVVAAEEAPATSIERVPMVAPSVEEAAGAVHPSMEPPPAPAGTVLSDSVW